jgi:hypothetical protein
LAFQFGLLPIIQPHDGDGDGDGDGDLNKITADLLEMRVDVIPKILPV